MLTIAYYFLQVVLCSGMMMGYYWLVLRNKRFHQYNRFYLLGVTVLSWIVPLIKITWNQPVALAQQAQVMRIFSILAYNNSKVEQTINRKGFEWNWQILSGIYISIASILLVYMLRGLSRLYFLFRNNPCNNVGEIYLILTNAKGTPFSFLRYIFWNEEIDIRSRAGQQILQHELAHVKQKHTFDKLLMQLILIGGWFNPFFWLIRKEMDMIHEFLADRKAVANGDTASLAQMLLTSAYPRQQFALVNPFFFSPIKRRLQMLTNNRNPSFSYARRLVVLPLLGMVVVLFSFRNKEEFKTLSLASVMGNVMNVKLEESPALVNFIRRKKIEPVNIENTAASFFYQRLTDKAAPVSGPLHLQKIAPQNAVSSNDTNYGRPRDWIFQGIANDPLGNVARSRMVYIRDLILQGSATGTEVWTETHVVTTDDEGKFIIYPGKGLAVPPAISVDIMKIDWSRGPFFLYMMTAVSPSIPAPWWLPSNNYNSMGTIELKESESAPQTIQFALDFTKTAGRDIKLEPNTTSTIEVPIAGVKKGDPILVKWNKEHVNWAIYSAWVSEDNRITVRFANYTDETINVSGSEYKIVAIR